MLWNGASLEGKKGITAVVCAYDNIALGAMTALKAHGLEGAP
ncbi:MAG: hypothetical protein ACLR23_06160 [Clostridia bacterium]